ncbi:hypothetical protein AgCh_019884 [Apium graveolens]
MSNKVFPSRELAHIAGRLGRLQIIALHRHPDHVVLGLKEQTNKNHFHVDDFNKNNYVDALKTLPREEAKELTKTINGHLVSALWVLGATNGLTCGDMAKVGSTYTDEAVEGPTYVEVAIVGPTCADMSKHFHIC